MSLINKFKRGASIGLVSLVSVFAGCSFNEGRERVTVPPFFILPGLGVMSIKHDTYETDEQKRIEYAIDTDVSVTLFGGQVDISVYGEERKFLWKYKTHYDKSGLKAYIYDSKKRKISTLDSVPSELPTAVSFTTSDWIHYLGLYGDSIDPSTLPEIDPFSLED